MLLKAILPWCGCLLASLALIYASAACAAVRRRVRGRGRIAGPQPAVTVLKPLCGTEPETYGCLRSFCVQDYPAFQLVFGLADPADPAAALVRRLQREFPARDIRLVIDRSLHGTSRKISNLINMSGAARHDYLVLADSDVRVQRGYLARVVAPLLDPKVGVVTCAYRGVPRRDRCSRLAAMFINEWFIPSVRIAALFGSRQFAFGATIALRREVLEAVGGFRAIANQLADDYRLGELTRRRGLRTVLSDVVVEICVADSRLGDLVRHELRWLRTIRTLRPLGFGLSFVTLGIPLAALGLLLAGGSEPTWYLFAAVCGARLALHRAVCAQRSVLRALIDVPLRDALTAGLWLWSFVNRSVHWRELRYEVSADGIAVSVVEG